MAKKQSTSRQDFVNGPHIAGRTQIDLAYRAVNEQMNKA
jgi:hypothetical protein